MTQSDRDALIRLLNAAPNWAGRALNGKPDIRLFMAQFHPPYFDPLFAELAKHNSSIEKRFGRHVHWGYWPDPAKARGDDDDDFARATEQLTRELTALACIADGQTVLDVGCGFGGTIASLNERFDSLRMIGLNIDVRQLSRAQQMVRPMRRNSISFCQADACVLPFADGSFERVIAIECVFHLPSREAFFKEVRRVLKPGGTLTLSDFVPAAAFLPLASLASLPVFQRLNPYGYTDTRYTLARYGRLAAEAGLAVVAERDITKNTLPTYSHLHWTAPITNMSRRRSSLLLDAQRAVATWGWLNYYLLSFAKL